MANGLGFIEPRFTSIPEKDSQIITIDFDNMAWAANPTSMPSDVKNENTIKHVNE